MTYTNNTLVSDGNWPAAAQSIAAAAGVEPAYAKNVPLTSVFGGNTQLGGLRAPVNIAFTGTWSHLRGLGDGPYSADISYTATNNDYVTITFTGKGLTVYGQTGPDRGNMGILLDGVAQPTVSAYNPTIVSRSALVRVSDLPYGQHTLRITKNDASKMTFDAYALDGYVNDSSPQLEYIGSWSASTNRTGASDDQQDVHYTVTNGDSVRLRFYGTSVKVITEKYSNQGDVQVKIDNRPAYTVSTYNSPSRLSRQTVVNVNDLLPGWHTITLTKLSGTYMLLDSMTVS